MVVTRCSFERGSPMVDRLRTDQEVVVRSPDQRSWLTSRPEVLTAISRARAPRGRVAAQRFWAGFPDWVVRIGNRIGV